MKQKCTDACSDWYCSKRGRDRLYDLDAAIWIHVCSFHLLSSSCQVFFLATSCAATPDRQRVCMEGAHRHTHTGTGTRALPARQGSALGATCT